MTSQLRSALISTPSSRSPMAFRLSRKEASASIISTARRLARPCSSRRQNSPIRSCFCFSPSIVTASFFRIATPFMGRSRSISCAARRSIFATFQSLELRRMVRKTVWSLSLGSILGPVSSSSFWASFVSHFFV